ncbi:MAG: Transcription initiation factor IIA subunit 1 [Marteilia pararefringens]
MNNVLSKCKELFEEHGLDENLIIELKKRWDIRFQKFQPHDFAGNLAEFPELPHSSKTNKTTASNIASKSPQLASSSPPSQSIDNSNENVKLKKSPDAKIATSDSDNSQPDGKRQKLTDQYDGLKTELMDDSEESDDPDNEPIAHDNKNVAGDDRIGDSGEAPTKHVSDSNNNSQNSLELVMRKGKEDQVQPEDTKPVKKDDNSQEAVDEQNNASSSGSDLLSTGEDDDSLDNQDSFFAENYIVCLHEKVSRSKSKWNVQLKNGIIHVNGREYTFCKANGILEW